MFEHYSDSNYMYVRSMEGVTTGRPYAGEDSGLDAGKSIVPGFQQIHMNHLTINYFQCSRLNG